LPVSTYVGHAGRHNPQCTQASARSYVRGSSPMPVAGPEAAGGLEGERLESIVWVKCVLQLLDYFPLTLVCRDTR
jgi:hypothetical protein